jgi:hypothetical protein
MWGVAVVVVVRAAWITAEGGRGSIYGVIKSRG